MSTSADSTRLSTLPSANADRPRAATGGRHIGSAGRHVAAVLVAEPLRHEERRGRPVPGDGRVGSDGGRMMHDRVLHMGGREARRVSFVWPGGVPGNGKGRRHLRRPHFSTLENIAQNASRVKQKMIFQDKLSGKSRNPRGFFLSSDSTPEPPPGPPNPSHATPRCHPGLEPGSRPPTGIRGRLVPDTDPGTASAAVARLLWTPAQGRGDSGGQRGQMRAGREPCPDPAEGPTIRLYQRLAPGSSPSRPHSGGLVPGMRTWDRGAFPSPIRASRPPVRSSM